MSLVVDLALGHKVSELALANELSDICDRVHSQCNNDCPVFKMNGSSVPDSVQDFKINRGCDCFKNGWAMLAFIRKIGK